jgi:serine/threonine-protein kinase RsbW
MEEIGRCGTVLVWDFKGDALSQLHSGRAVKMSMKLTSNKGNVRAEGLSLTLESSVESAGLAQSQIVHLAERAKYGKQQCEEIGLAVRESVANAVLHGNHSDVNKKVFLTAEMQPHGLVISIRDEGEGFDPESLPDPLITANLRRESGRGLILVKALMDEVILRRATLGGMELTMTKYLSRRT